MKHALEQHFERKYARWKAYKNTLPMIGWDEDVSPFMYVGDVNSEGYVQWKAVEKDEVYDFRQIQDDLHFNLNNDIKNYFNSFWFLELTGKHKGFSIILEPVIPGIGLRDFRRNLEAYSANHNHQLTHIPIGFEANGSLVVVHNDTGKIYMEDHETGSFEEIAVSLEELINQL